MRRVLKDHLDLAALLLELFLAEVASLLSVEEYLAARGLESFITSFAGRVLPEPDSPMRPNISPSDIEEMPRSP
jgi:hypothetical protein